MYSKVILKKDKERSVLNFHPWIFSGAIANKSSDLFDGHIVEVYSASGNYLCTGHYANASITIKILSFNRSVINAEFWNEKIKAATRVRISLGFFNSSNTCFRLIHGEADGMPGLIVDIYNDTAVMQCHSAGMSAAAEEIATALQKNIPMIQNIYDKTEEKYFKLPDRNIAGTKTDDIVSENELKFYVNWKEGQKTGFFCDQRLNRQLLRSFCRGKKVLNLFSYSGGFSVYALSGGAHLVHSVDSSSKAKDWCEKNIAMNFKNANHEFSCTNAIDHIRQTGEQYDVIIADPPAFAKHMSAVENASVAYRNLNYDVFTKIATGGIVFTFSCSQVIDNNHFRKIIFKAAAQSKRSIRILHQLSQPPDHPVSVYHPEGEYLKGLVLYVE